MNSIAQGFGGVFFGLFSVFGKSHTLFEDFLPEFFPGVFILSLEGKWWRRAEMMEGKFKQGRKALEGKGKGQLEERTMLRPSR
jgi:hypothetical protein